MALFDPGSGMLVVRIVYDGLAHAGKTTNLQRLCGFFAARRRSELYTPESLDGRTGFFDWLRLDAGLVMGHRLRCHMITVPGQAAHAERRDRLLAMADVVVFVCDSRPHQVLKARARFDSIRSGLERTGGTRQRLLLQANKQDLPGALPAGELAAILEADLAAQVVLAEAVSGVGVRETAVLAIRAAADLAQRQILAEGVESLPTDVVDANELYEAMRAAEPTRAMAGSVLELDATAKEERLLAELATAPANEQPANEQPGSQPDEVRPRSATERSTAPPPRMHDEVSASPSGNALFSPERTTRPLSVPPDDVDDDVRETHVPNATAAVEPAMASREDENLRDRREGSPSREWASRVPTASLPPDEMPPDDELCWPVDTVPSGFIWPGIRGREVVGSLDFVRARARPDLVAQPGHLDGSGRTDLRIFELKPWCIKTSLARRFDDHEAARVALAHLARAKVSLGRMLLKDTILVLSRGQSGTWLWTIAPWAPTLRSLLSDAHKDGDAEALGEALRRYADITVDALRLALSRGVIIDVHPSNFVVHDGDTRYVDDDIAVGGSVPMLGHSALQRLVEYDDAPNALDAYVNHLVDALTTRITADESRRLRLTESFESAQPSTALALAARERIVSSLEGRRR